MQSEIINSEALIDALTFWSAGYRNVTAAYGVEGFTDEMLTAFKQHGIKRVLIAYDRDEAGDRGAEKLAAKLTAENIEAWRILFPKGMDANDYALKVQPAAKSLGLLIRKAQWLGKGTAPVIEGGIEMETPVPAETTPAAKEKDHAGDAGNTFFSCRACCSSESQQAQYRLRRSSILMPP